MINLMSVNKEQTSKIINSLTQKNPNWKNEFIIHSPLKSVYNQFLQYLISELTDLFTLQLISSYFF